MRSRYNSIALFSKSTFPLLNTTPSALSSRFFFSIPALLAAGAYELKDALGGSIEVGPLVVCTVVSFVVAYGTVAWLLKFVAHHSIVVFVWYRVALGVLLIGLLATGTIPAT